MRRKDNFYIGMKVLGDHPTYGKFRGTVIDKYIYEDDDGYDEETGRQIILRWHYIKVELPDGRILNVSDSYLKPSEVKTIKYMNYEYGEDDFKKDIYNLNIRNFTFDELVDVFENQKPVMIEVTDSYFNSDILQHVKGPHFVDALDFFQWRIVEKVNSITYQL